MGPQNLGEGEWGWAYVLPAPSGSAPEFVCTQIKLYYVGQHFCNLQAFISYLPTSNNGAPEDKILSVLSCSTKHFNSSSVTVSVLCYCYDSADLPFGADTQFYIADLPFLCWGEGGSQHKREVGTAEAKKIENPPQKQWKIH